MVDKSIVLAYSGGLDTAVILKWLQIEYAYKVITYTADLGQISSHEQIKEQALALGAHDVYIEDIQSVFIENYVYPMLYSNARYEDRYLLGTAIARPLIAKRQVNLAKNLKIRNVAHGCTGKGNDQVRFDLVFYSLYPDAIVISPWREWDLQSRHDLVQYARDHNFLDKIPRSGKSYNFSIDENIFHSSCEGGEIEDLGKPIPNSAYRRTSTFANMQNNGEEITLVFSQGRCIQVNDNLTDSRDIMQFLNKRGGIHGIGQCDCVESRITGMKSRGFYETPGGTILAFGHKILEEITLDSEVIRIKNILMPLYADIVYRGLWFSPEREMLQKAFDETQRYVDGSVTLFLYKGSVQPKSRSSPYSLYSSEKSTFGSGDKYNHAQSEGYIKTVAERLKCIYKVRQEKK